MKGSRAGPPCIVMFLDPPVQEIFACLRPDPYKVVSIDWTVTPLLDGAPAKYKSHELLYLTLLWCRVTLQLRLRSAERVPEATCHDEDKQLRGRWCRRALSFVYVSRPTRQSRPKCNDNWLLSYLVAPGSQQQELRLAYFRKRCDIIDFRNSF